MSGHHWTDRLSGSELIELQRIRLEAAKAIGNAALHQFLEDTDLEWIVPPHPDPLPRGEREERPIDPPSGKGEGSLRKSKGTEKKTSTAEPRRRGRPGTDAEVRARGLELRSAGNSHREAHRILLEEFGERAPKHKSSISYRVLAAKSGAGKNACPPGHKPPDKSDCSAKVPESAKRRNRRLRAVDPAVKQRGLDLLNEGKTQLQAWKILKQEFGARAPQTPSPLSKWRRAVGFPSHDEASAPGLNAYHSPDVKKMIEEPEEEPVSAIEAEPEEAPEQDEETSEDHIPDAGEMVEEEPEQEQEEPQEEHIEPEKPNLMPCLRDGVPEISRESCIEWQVRWRSPRSDPKKAAEKIRKCLGCSKWVPRTQDLPIKHDPSVPEIRPRGGELA